WGGGLAASQLRALQCQAATTAAIAVEETHESLRPDEFVKDLKCQNSRILERGYNHDDSQFPGNVRFDTTCRVMWWVRNSGARAIKNALKPLRPVNFSIIHVSFLIPGNWRELMKAFQSSRRGTGVAALPRFHPAARKTTP